MAEHAVIVTFTYAANSPQPLFSLADNMGKLLGIELYELGGDDIARRFPAIGALRRWEDYYPLPPEEP